MKKILLPLLLIITHIAIGQVDLNLGLRAYYPFTGNANDVSGNNNNPVFNNATLTADRFGNPNSAYHFNGIDNYMRVTDNATLNMGNKMSIAIWVKATGYYTGPCYNSMCVMKSNPATLPSNYFIRFADIYNGCTSPSTTQERFAGNNVVAATPFVQLNQWYSVVWTSDGVTEKIYVNCELKGSVPAGGVPYTNISDLLMGKNVDPSFPYWLDGDLDEVRLYDRALNQDEVNVLGDCVIPFACNNWLRTQAVGQSVTVGDLDISGNQVTVEANFNCSSFPLTRPDKQEDIVSKHSNTTDINYVLRMDLAGITTTNGQFLTPLPCDNLVTNKTYHVAMVYNGSSLKFYRDGFLMSQIAASGNLILNNWLTTIGDYAVNNPVGTNFLGYINEVRIWNVARTQAQIQTYMNSSLPNPTTQTGLQGYYTFDNLVNKQGNATWNGTLNGGATINNTNPNCTFVADSCIVTPPPPVCNSSFELAKTNNSYVRVLPAAPATYNQLYNSNGFSWETWFKLTGPITNLSTLVSTEDAVLFHDIFLGFGWGSIPNALCFLVSDNGANNATVYAESAQSLTVGTWYHVAAVCDYSNAILRLYLNGNIIATKPIPIGILNDRLSTNVSTQLGNASSSLIYGINANIDETRFWNTVRSQAEIQASMNQCLSNPQPGLVAYFKADELVGTTAASAVNNNFSGSLSNTTWGTQTPSVNCGCVTSTSVIINDYTPVLALNPCTNTLTVENATAYNVGDTVLLIQMKGAVIDSTNTAAFGTITDYKNSGNYEYNYVKTKTGNIIELKNTLTRQYDIPVGKVQLIRVPYYTNLTTTDTLTCLPWDGNKGGVLVFNVQNTLTLGADMNVSGKGFKGGIGYNPGNATLSCFQNNYFYPINTIQATYKGESISSVSNNIICGKGNLAGGGGGGAGHNSGGGGGGNGGPGGFGGYQLDNCGSAPFDNRGIGGRQLAYSTANNRIFMGSGGGAGHADNPGNTPPAGGNGAGIIIVNADKIQANSKKIIANGNNGLACSAPSPDCHDAMGGGGAGGTVLLSVNQYLDNSIVENKGGKGADVVSGNIAAAGRIGPGGGGAGGLAFLKAASLPANLSIVNTGGVNGVLTQDANNPWGATPGAAGQNLFNLVLPIDNIPFKTNIDSVRIKDSLLNCNGFDFKGLAYINTAPIASWQWYFGDGGQATTQNTSHAYTAAGLYTVKLIVTDINGCIDSTSKDVNALPGVNAEAGADTSICTNGSASVTLNGTAVGGPYLWSPAIYLNNPNIQNPVATISTTTTFYLNVTGSASCTSIDSVTIYINPLPLVNTRTDTAICRLSPLVLNTVSNAVSYQWSPPAYVSNPNIASPNYIDNFSHRVYVTGTSALGCKATDSLDVTVNPLPVVQTIADTTLCQSENVTLTTTGAQTYSWNPAIGLSNPAIASPVFIGNSGQTYTVTGTDANGCKNNDLVTINVIMPGSFKAPPAFTICQKQSVQLDGNNGNQVSYLWSPATYLSNATIINPLANPPQTTLYTLLVTDNRCGYDSIFTTLLTVLPAPFISVRKSNDIDCALKSATLFASGGNQYLWSPSAGLNNPNISSPVATPSNTQTYTVLVKDATGCTNTDSVTIFIKKAASLARYMPNAFTPDGNGINDCYGLKNWMYIQKLQFYIFNRYGEQVFATSNPKVCWNGTYKGKPALAGAYVYVIKAQTDCGEEEQKGSFLLIR